MPRSTACLNALREITPDLPRQACSMSAPGRERRAGPRRRHFRRCKFALLDANGALRALALDLARDSARLRDMNYRRGEARAALADAEPADLVVASYMIGEIGDAEQGALAERCGQRPATRC